MTFQYSAAAQSDAMTAAAGAANGVKRAAYLASWQSSIGSNAKLVLYRDAVNVWSGAITGALPVVGPAIVIEAVTQVAVSAADIDTGAWELRVEKASDAAVYFGATVAASEASNVLKLSADLETDSTVGVSLTFTAPALDTIGGGGGDTGSGITLALLQSDVNQSLAHEMYLDGVPLEWSWGSHANLAVGANPPQLAGWGSPAFVVWGVASTERNNAPGVHNWRLAVHSMLSFEKRGGQWMRQSSDWHTPPCPGAMYTDYETNASVAANKRETNGYSEIKFPNNGGSFHFFTDRTPVGSTGAQHRATLINASLTLDNPAGIDDRAAARVVVLTSGDYWKTISIPWSSTQYTNDGFFVGRARKPALWPSTSWHSAHTMTSDADVNEFIAWLATQGIG